MYFIYSSIPQIEILNTLATLPCLPPAAHHLLQPHFITSSSTTLYYPFFEYKFNLSRSWKPSITSTIITLHRHIVTSHLVVFTGRLVCLPLPLVPSIYWVWSVVHHPLLLVQEVTTSVHFFPRSFHFHTSQPTPALVAPPCSEYPAHPFFCVSFSVLLTVSLRSVIHASFPIIPCHVPTSSFCSISVILVLAHPCNCTFCSLFAPRHPLPPPPPYSDLMWCVSVLCLICSFLVCLSASTQYCLRCPSAPPTLSWMHPQCTSPRRMPNVEE